MPLLSRLLNGTPWGRRLHRLKHQVWDAGVCLLLLGVMYAASAATALHPLQLRLLYKRSTSC
jgi:hypothetical protein